jgi:ribonuclease BN (tRNA processing enzyme)
MAIHCNKFIIFSLAMICLFVQQTSHGQDTTLTLLGTGGGPGGDTSRAGIASLLTVNGTHYLFDAGESVARQLAFAGLIESDIHHVFLTHLHDDHTVGLSSLVSFAHTRRTSGLTVYGPPNTAALLDGILAYQARDAEIRIAEQGQGLRDPLELFQGQDLGPGVVYEDENLRITAVENTHYNIPETHPASINKSYSYRVETADKVIVFTGDTGPSEAVEKLAQGADILVSEMVTNEALASVPAFVMEHMLEEHLSNEEVGKLAQLAEVEMLVISHTSTVTQEEIDNIARYYQGTIIVGEDLAQF